MFLHIGSWYRFRFTALLINQSAFPSQHMLSTSQCEGRWISGQEGGEHLAAAGEGVVVGEAIDQAGSCCWFVVMVSCFYFSV